jgi:acyl phosphate:glycerol-3-phosphate acyltransferase
MEYGFSLIIGYLAGSIPAAYLILKKTRGIDITAAGSGNVGAMNAYEVTDSKFLGILVLIVDAIKGFLSVFIPLLIFPNEFTPAAIGLLAAVFSHCYNPWLDFKGGRGLATAAGGAIFIFPMMLLIWLILWAIVFFLKKDIHFGNIAASVLSIFVIFNLSSLAYKYTNPKAESVSEIVVFTAALLILILIRHIEPLKDLLKNPKFMYRKRR